MTTKTAEQTNGHMTADEMKQALANERAERVQACANALNAILEQYDCEMAAVPGLTVDGRVVASVQVRAK